MPALEITIINKLGLHARAAAKLAALCETLPGEITVSANGVSATGRSIMGLMLLGAAQNSEIHVTATGPDAGAALEALENLIQEKFGETE